MVGTAKRTLISLLCIVLFVTALNPIIALGLKPSVYDEGMLFTEEEIKDLEDKANSLSNKYNMDIVILTTNDAKGKSSREYADDFFDYGGFGVGENYDGILFLIDMDNREVYISTSGTGISFLTDERRERVLDKVFNSGLGDGNYYGATIGFLEETQSFLENGIPSGQYNYPEPAPRPKNRLTSTDVILSLLGGLVFSSIFYFITSSRYKTPKSGNSFRFRNNSIVNLAQKEDKLVDTFVTFRTIPKPTNTSGSSGGRSTTHRSSSGRTHGGGGRKF